MSLSNYFAKSKLKVNQLEKLVDTTRIAKKQKKTKKQYSMKVPPDYKI